jgi:hypothetical protein
MTRFEDVGAGQIHVWFGGLVALQTRMFLPHTSAETAPPTGVVIIICCRTQTALQPLSQTYRALSL